MGTQFVLTQWIQGPQHHSPLATGLYFVPTAVTSILFALLNPRMAARWGHGLVAGIGLAVTAAGALVAALSVLAESLPGVVVAGTLIGIGIGVAAVSSVELIMSSARPERAGSASGVNETLIEASGALGIAVLGSVLVETGSYAWPLPVVALATAATAIGIALAFRPSRAIRRSPVTPRP
jgi:DHA2 family multidrug resistance protein-like MFS transporter